MIQFIVRWEIILVLNMNTDSFEVCMEDGQIIGWANWSFTERWTDKQIEIQSYSTAEGQTDKKSEIQIEIKYS